MLVNAMLRTASVAYLIAPAARRSRCNLKGDEIRRQGRSASRQDGRRKRGCRDEPRYRAHRPRRRFQRSPGGRAAGGFKGGAKRGTDVCSTGAGAAAAISAAGAAIGCSIVRTATGLALGGRPRRGFGKPSSATSAVSGSIGTGSGTIRLGRIRRGSGAGVCGSAAEGQNTRGRGTTVAVSRCGMMGRLRPPDLVSTVNDFGERLRITIRIAASGVGSRSKRGTEPIPVQFVGRSRSGSLRDRSQTA